jgi:hypothetical protein
MTASDVAVWLEHRAVTTSDSMGSRGLKRMGSHPRQNLEEERDAGNRVARPKAFSIYKMERWDSDASARC